MSSFKDTNGRSWPVRITVATIRRIKDLTGLELGSLSNSQALADISGDYLRLSRVLYAIVKPDADAVKITEDQFLDALSGDCLEQASSAFVEALADFFPGAQGRLIRTAMKQAEKQMQDALEKAGQSLESSALPTNSQE